MIVNGSIFLVLIGNNNLNVESPLGFFGIYSTYIILNI